jgi:hypothetical protein
MKYIFKTHCFFRGKQSSRWLTPTILATHEAEIRRISDLKPALAIVLEILPQKKTHYNVGPEFKP